MALQKKDIFADKGRLETVFNALYGGKDAVVPNVKRYEFILKRYVDLFGDEAVEFFSSPGRIEITGNHTDHNGGKVLTSSISLDSIAAAAPNLENKIIVQSEGYSDTFTIDLNDLGKREEDSSAQLIRGLAAGMKKTRV